LRQCRLLMSKLDVQTGSKVTSSVPVACACCCIQYTPVRWTGNAAPIRCDLWHPCYTIGCCSHSLKRSCCRPQNGGVVRRVRFQLDDGIDPLLLVLHINLIGTQSLHCKKCSLVWTTGFLVYLAHPMRANAFFCST
jgi:hypothetical protein